MASTRKVLGEIDERVEHALMVERVLTSLGWFVLMLGVIGLGAIALQRLWGDLTAEKALAAAGGTTLDARPSIGTSFVTCVTRELQLPRTAPGLEGPYGRRAPTRSPTATIASATALRLALFFRACERIS
jgi:hypothetical protein